MKIEIVTQFPAWYFVFCVLLGLLYAGLAYYRHKKNSEIARWIVVSLFSIRLLSVSALSFLLLVPFIKTISSHIEKPVLIIAADNSRSVVANGVDYGTKGNAEVQKIKYIQSGS